MDRPVKSVLAQKEAQSEHDRAKGKDSEHGASDQGPSQITVSNFDESYLDGLSEAIQSRWQKVEWEVLGEYFIEKKKEFANILRDCEYEIGKQVILRLSETEIIIERSIDGDVKVSICLLYCKQI
jgi:hypothetical protein